MKKELKAAVGYVRCASHAQDGNNGISIQIKVIEEAATKYGYYIEEWYVDKAESGRDTNRSEYQRAWKDIKSGNVKAEAFFVKSLDRLHRNVNNELIDVNRFKEMDVRFISVENGIDTYDTNYDVFSVQMSGTAQRYFDKISMETKVAMSQAGRYISAM